MRVGVVGAGVSGLVCGTRLSALLRGADIPVKVTVLEWGRGPGGRTARRRVNVEGVGEVSFDHAAPFFTATTAQFRREVLLDWEARSLVSRWAGQGETCLKVSEEPGQLWVGVPSNHAVCQGLVAELKESGAEHLYGRHVTSARFVGNMWRVTAVNRLANPPTEETLEFDALVLSDKLLVMPNVYAVLPPEELGPLSLLLSADPEAIHAAATADALPSQSAVVLLLALAVPLPEALQAAFGNSRAVFGDALREALGPQCDLALVVHDSAKPGRPGGGGEGGGEGRVELFVVHSTERFAKVHLVADRGGGPVLDDPDAVRDHLCRQFYDAAGKLGAAASARSGPEAWPAPAYAAAVAWDHASVAPEHRLRGSHRVDGLRRVGLCGDFFGGFSESEGVGAVMGGVEAAALSGVALAGELAAVLIEKHAADRGAASRSAAI